MSEKEASKKNKSMGVFDYVFSSYESLAHKWKKSAICRVLYKASVSKWWASLRRRIAGSAENSLILGAVRRFTSALPSVTLRAYGTFIFSLGFYSGLVCVIKAIASTLEADTDSLVFAGMLILVSIPLLLSGKTLAASVYESKFGSFVAFDLFGYRRSEALALRKVIKRCDISMVLGMAFGLLSFSVDIERIVAGIVVTLAVYFVLTAPEGGTVAFMALAPILPSRLIDIYITVLALGYFFKLITGKRTFKLDLADSLMLVFAGIILLGDVIHYGNGTEKEFGFHFVAVLTYFLTVNLIRSEKWRESCKYAVTFGGVVASVLIIAEHYLYEKLDALSFASGTLETVKRTLLSLMDTSEESVIFTVAVLPMLLASVARRRSAAREGIATESAGGAAISAVLVIAAIVISGSRSLWLGAAVGFTVLLVFVNLKYAVIPAAIAAAVPMSILILPDRLSVYVKSLFDFTGVGSLANINVRENSIGMMLDSFIGGIGGASGVFSEYYGAYTGTGVTPDSAKNLILGVGVTYGVTGLLIFAVAIVFLIIKMYTRAKSDQSGAGKAILAGFASFLFVGLTLDFLSDSKLFVLFFMYTAFASSYTSVRPTPSHEMAEPVSNEKTATKDIEFD